MPIMVPEVASRMAGIDSDIFADGAPLSAMKLRLLSMQSNRLLAKPQGLGGISWPMNDPTETHGSLNGGIVPHHWVRALPPLEGDKMPGLDRLSVRMTVRTSNGMDVFWQVVTRRRHLNTSATGGEENCIRVTGTGDWQDIDFDGILMDRGPHYRVELYVRAVASQILGNTAAYGTPNVGSFDELTENTMRDRSATWDADLEPTQSWFQAGHYLQFQDSNGTDVGVPREITGVYSRTGYVGVPRQADTLEFQWKLKGDEILAARTGGHYAIYRLPQWDICDFAMAAMERTFS